jgi:hypothetical protein
MRQGKTSAAEKRADRPFGDFARSIRRNLRQAHRIRERADQAARLCDAKAGAAMLDAKASSGMTDEGFAAWLMPFNLSQDRLLQCLELGQVVLQRRKAKAMERDESFGILVAERRSEVGSSPSRSAIARRVGAATARASAIGGRRDANR